MTTYQPRTPHQHELLGRASFASTLRIRHEDSYTAQASENVEKAQFRINRAHEKDVEAHKARFAKQPALAVAGLRQTALGCRWLI